MIGGRCNSLNTDFTLCSRVTEQVTETYPIEATETHLRIAILLTSCDTWWYITWKSSQSHIFWVYSWTKKEIAKTIWLRILRSQILPEHRWWRSGKNVIMRKEHPVLRCELEDRDLIEWHCMRSHMTSVQFNCAPRNMLSFPQNQPVIHAAFTYFIFFYF